MKEWEGNDMSRNAQDKAEIRGNVRKKRCEVTPYRYLPYTPANIMYITTSA